MSEKNSIIQDVGSGEVEEEPCYADTLNLLRQTRDGGYVRKKGINIETSPDAVSKYYLIFVYINFLRPEKKYAKVFVLRALQYWETELVFTITLENVVLILSKISNVNI